MHTTREWSQANWVGDHPEHTSLALFCDASFAADIRDSKSTSAAYLVLIGPHTYVPISWFCKKQTAVSHSSSEAEIIALDAALRLEGLPALNFWELVIDVLSSEPQTTASTKYHTYRPKDLHHTPMASSAQQIHYSESDALLRSRHG